MGVLNKYLSEIEKHTCEFGKFAYRGQRNSGWPLESSAIRRLKLNGYKSKILFNETYVSYHEQLIAKSKTLGFEVGNNHLDHLDSPLSLLSHIQHFGAATCLLDFTWNPLVALWFACKDEISNEGDDHSEKDGHLFICDTDDTNYFRSVQNYQRLDNNESEFDLSKFLTTPNKVEPSIFYWEPKLYGSAERRIVRQQSVFIVGRPWFPEKAYSKIKINKKDKKSILSELEMMDITERSMYPDIVGFCSVESHKSPIKTLQGIQGKLKIANEQYQRGEFDAAIRSYSQCLLNGPNFAELHFLRGNAYAESKRHIKSIKDYDIAIDSNRRRGGLALFDLYKKYFNRANANFALSDFKKAVCDYTNSISSQMSGSQNSNLYFNRGNAYAKLERWQDAASDFDEAFKLGYFRAMHNKGNALVLLCKFEEALDCFRHCIENSVQTNLSHGHRNLLNVEKIIRLVEDSQFEYAKPIRSSNGITIYPLVIEDSENIVNKFEFIGNVGNVGNFGGHFAEYAQEGGSGYDGSWNFLIEVYK